MSVKYSKYEKYSATKVGDEFDEKTLKKVKEFKPMHMIESYVNGENSKFKQTGIQFKLVKD